MTLQQKLFALHALSPRKVSDLLAGSKRANELQTPVIICEDRACLFPTNIMTSPDGLWTERGRTLVSCLCPFFIVSLDRRSETMHMERPVCREGVFSIPICALCRHRAQSRHRAQGTGWPLNMDCPQLNLSRHYRSFLHSSIILLIQQIKWEKSDPGCQHYFPVAINHKWMQVASVSMWRCLQVVFMAVWLV